MYGTQTTKDNEPQEDAFENDVKMYGTQTKALLIKDEQCLRMM